MNSKVFSKHLGDGVQLAFDWVADRPIGFTLFRTKNLPACAAPPSGNPVALSPVHCMAATNTFWFGGGLRVPARAPPANSCLWATGHFWISPIFCFFLCAFAPCLKWRSELAPSTCGPPARNLLCRHEGQDHAFCAKSQRPGGSNLASAVGSLRGRSVSEPRSHRVATDASGGLSDYRFESSLLFRFLWMLPVVLLPFCSGGIARRRLQFLRAEFGGASAAALAPQFRDIENNGYLFPHRIRV